MGPDDLSPRLFAVCDQGFRCLLGVAEPEWSREDSWPAANLPCLLQNSNNCSHKNIRSKKKLGRLKFAVAADASLQRLFDDWKSGTGTLKQAWRGKSDITEPQ